MKTEIINNIIEELFISKYEETLITKYKYNIKMSNYEILRLKIVFKKIKMLNLIGDKI